MICPVCGGTVRRIRHMGPGGTRHFSLCCRIPLEVIDNWDVIEGLPEDMREQAIASARAAHEAIYQREAEMAEEYKRLPNLVKQYPHLYKETEETRRWL